VTGESVAKTVITAFLLTVILASPLWADDVAKISPQTHKICTLSGMLGRAQTMLKPVMETSGLTLVATHDEIISGNVQNMEERFLNLLSNAVVHAPAGTAIKVNYHIAANQLQIWVENSAINHSIKRDVTDAMGNTFTLETMNGKGTVYAINF